MFSPSRATKEAMWRERQASSPDGCVSEQLEDVEAQLMVRLLRGRGRVVA